jgi:hypothetical protein
MAKHQKAIDAERNFRKKVIGEISSEFSESLKPKFIQRILCRTVEVEGRIVE